MKVVFCTDDKIRYLSLLKVAVRSLRHVMGNSAECLCVYAGNNQNTIDILSKENIPISRYSPRLQIDNTDQHMFNVKGCFLKLELCLLPELQNDEYVLYCDTDVMFKKPLDELFKIKPKYMAMAREYTAPFFHDHAELKYTLNNKEYTVPMPFPIWTFSSGVVLFNLSRLRKQNLIDHFLAFSQQNLHNIGNLDQSLLNYYFGKKITKLEERWNKPPYHADCHTNAHIVHFHGTKPWEGNTTISWQKELTINDFSQMSTEWNNWLSEEERNALVGAW